MITRNCWPAMLDSLGFTSEEADILRGYCDAEVAAQPPSQPLPTSTGNGYVAEEIVA